MLEQIKLTSELCSLKIILCNSSLRTTCNNYYLFLLAFSIRNYNTCDNLIHFPGTKYSIISIHLAKLHSYGRLHNYLCFILIKV